MSDLKQRTKCHRCRRAVALRANDTMATHLTGDGRTVCTGSGMYPEPVDRPVEDVLLPDGGTE